MKKWFLSLSFLFSALSFADNRQPVNFGDETGSVIASNVGYLVSKRDDGKLTNCTATRIHSDYLITAAHCVMGYLTGSLNKEFKFYPGINGGKRFGAPVILGSDVYILEDYVGQAVSNSKKSSPFLGNGIMNNDIAIVEIESHEKDTLKPPAVSFNKGLFNFNSMRADIYSYPGDKPKRTAWKESCKIEINGLKFVNKTSCKIRQGSSGAALYQEIDGMMAITGVVTASSGYGRGLISMIDEERRNDILSIIEGGDPGGFLQFRTNK